MIYLNPHWQLTLAVPRFGSLTHSPNHLFLRTPRHIIAKIEIKCYNFCGFLSDRVLVMESAINNSPILKGYW